jgi:hypothetical protein
MPDVVGQGIMSPPNPNPEKNFTVTAEVVNIFYNTEEVSRAVPVKRDYISIEIHGVKMHE